MSAPDSRLVMNYTDAERAHKKITLLRTARWFGEPVRFGWDPDRLPLWTREHGFTVLADHSDLELAARYFPPPLSTNFPNRGGHVAILAPNG